MLTANTLPEHIAKAMAAGADLHLAEPITPGGLLGAVGALSVTARPTVAQAV
jgi:CheY-like chemotaxis protein